MGRDKDFNGPHKWALKADTHYHFGGKHEATHSLLSPKRRVLYEFPLFFPLRSATPLACPSAAIALLVLQPLQFSVVVRRCEHPFVTCKSFACV